MNEVIDGEYKVFGKVVRVVKEADNSINRLRNTCRESIIFPTSFIVINQFALIAQQIPSSIFSGYRLSITLEIM
jgi:hypothetical protein